jgi:tetratricopeptide (TPR) repeat protein
MLLVYLPGLANEKPELEVASLMQLWSRIQYHTPQDVQPQEFLNLLQHMQALGHKYPQSAEPMVWEAITLASYAQAERGRKGLKAIKQARDLLLSAERINPMALNGAIYITLGRIYAKAPHWPISFGSTRQARFYLEKALTINPDSMEANCFYADLLDSQGDYSTAIEYYEKALAAPARPGQEDADAGRRLQIEAGLRHAKARSGLSGIYSVMGNQ